MFKGVFERWGTRKLLGSRVSPLSDGLIIGNPSLNMVFLNMPTAPLPFIECVVHVVDGWRVLLSGVSVFCAQRCNTPIHGSLFADTCCRTTGSTMKWKVSDRASGTKKRDNATPWAAGSLTVEHLVYDTD